MLCDWLMAYRLYKHIPESGCSNAANGMGPMLACVDNNADDGAPTNMAEEGDEPFDGAIIMDEAAGGSG